MKRFLASLVAVLGIGALAQGQVSPSNGATTELRAMALAIRPVDLGLAPEQFVNKPWGVLMETGLASGATYSLVVFADGSTSLYFSNGGGVIGAGEHQSVRTAARSMLDVAARLQDKAQPAFSTPLPRQGKVQFYLLTSKGTLGYNAEEQALGQGKDALSELFLAGHAVITQVRFTEEAKSPRGKQ